MASELVQITNISRQRIDIQVQRKDGDFYLEQQQARLLPGKSVVLPRDHIMPAQLENLQARRSIRTANIK